MNPEQRGMDEKLLRLAVPSKGRLAQTTEEILRRAGLRYRRRERRLYARCKGMDILLVFSRAADVPRMVDGGAVDLGVTGSDVLREQGLAVDAVLPLGFGRSRMVLAVRDGSGYERREDLAGRTIGTSYPQTARAYFEGVEPEVRLLTLSGATEVMVGLGLVDGIVEIVETGDSLAENHLHSIEEIASSEAVLVARRGQVIEGEVSRLIRRIEGVLQARRYSLLEYNLPRDLLEQATQITPGFSSPTVQETADSEWLAVKVMVEKVDVPGIMDQLEGIGARAILETEVANSRL
ncbi:MAG: ATP phosphoribosyltransferase [Planctomycetota bacterium]|jgi:ATP phosphoribosyltransferase|nr:ATP phosphoribosyltransferase [Planctomycetota bacterium]